jgi:hypothetical protein
LKKTKKIKKSKKNFFNDYMNFDFFKIYFLIFYFLFFWKNSRIRRGTDESHIESMGEAANVLLLNSYSSTKSFLQTE